MTTPMRRTAESANARTILELVRELAELEGLLDQLGSTEADIRRDGNRGEWSVAGPLSDISRHRSIENNVLRV